MNGSQMTKKIWSSDVTIYYRWSNKSEKLKMKFEDVKGSNPNDSYRYACERILLTNEVLRKIDENGPILVILGGCAVFNFEE
jgi:hypothetical protein